MNSKPKRPDSKPTAQSNSDSIVLLSISRAELSELIADGVAAALETRASAPELVDDAAMARALDVSTATLRRMLPQGVPHVIVGDCRRYRIDTVYQWLAARSQQGGAK